MTFLCLLLTVWLNVMDGISIVFIEQDVYLFSPSVWKYCTMTRERINTSFCTERVFIGHLGRRWAERGRMRTGLFVCIGYGFYRDGFGWLAQGERSLGVGAFLETKAGSHPSENFEREGGGVWDSFYLSVLVKIYGPSFPFISLLPPSILLSFLIPLSHEAPLPPPKKTHMSDLWQWGICMSTNRAQVQTQPLTPSIIPLTACLSCCVCLLSFVDVPFLPLRPLTCYLFFLSCVLYSGRPSPPPTCSVALWLPLRAPGPHIKGSMRISPITSELHTCT